MTSLKKRLIPEKKTDRIPVNFIEGTDGDTFKVLLDGKEEKVRLLLVDTPENVKQGTPVQPFAKEASNFTLAQLKKGNLTLELDVSERDKYGRLLVYAWVGDKMLNELLLEKDYARVAYIYPPNVKHVDQFEKIQVKAQNQDWNLEH
ncbi:thermonuclease family protein [Paenibacillus sp. FSL K6-1318]|uniref:thermonuclease family protein n=1 Tax=Paenibacillus sp. FSL K6-1318 TaxID=2975291 RepID=UPI0030ECE6ED